MKDIKEKAMQFLLMLFIFFTIWWLWLFLFVDKTSDHNLVFGALYGTSLTIFGSFYGFLLARGWGGWRSLLGRAMIILSFGLLAQFVGQFIFSYYNIILKIDVPYPSLADIGYFGSIPLYIYGMWLLAKASGVKISKEFALKQWHTLLIPVFILCFSYAVFLRSYEFDLSRPFLLFLDFGYPLGQAIYVSLALLTYVLSRSTLGGLLRENILLFIFAFFAQYVADFNFLYQNLHETWYNGGYGDYLYLFAYFLMIFAFIRFGMAYKQIRSGEATTTHV